VFIVSFYHVAKIEWVSRKVTTKSKLGARITAAGLTGVETARRARIHPVTVSRYCAMRKPIPPHHLMKLAEVLECEPEEIAGLT